MKQIRNGPLILVSLEQFSFCLFEIKLVNLINFDFIFCSLLEKHR